MKWWWQVSAFLGCLTFLFFIVQIWRWWKVNVIWSYSLENVHRTLTPIWNTAGIVEIVGGAETGKTLLIILLTKYLWGRKWNNVPNIIPGCQELDLERLRKIWIGEFEKGLVGSNNVLLIDEVWNFFSSENCQKAHFNSKDLSSLLFFLSETSKTQFKIFYVKKQGIKLNNALNILEANKTAQIRCLGIRNYSKFWGKKYFYLDFEWVTPKELQNYKPLPTPKNVSRYELKENHYFRKSYKPWLTFLGEQTVFSLPFTTQELEAYDKTWNLDRTYEMQREISIYDKLAADLIIETCRYKKSRTQLLTEENDILIWWKRHPSPSRVKEMMIRGWMIAKKRGLWKPAGEKLNAEEAVLKKNFKLGKIGEEEYKLGMRKIFAGRAKLAIAIEEKQREENTEKENDPFKEVPVEIKPEENE